MKRLSLVCLLAALGACGESPAPAPAPAPTVAPAAPAPTVAPAAPAPAASASTIPAAFHGEWNASVSGCGGAANDTRLRIAADRVRFHESSGAVASVTVHSEHEITVVARLTGEGQAWDHTRRWRLAPDGSTLQDVTEGAGPVRIRCP